MPAKLEESKPTNRNNVKCGELDTSPRCHVGLAVCRADMADVRGVIRANETHWSKVSLSAGAARRPEGGDYDAGNCCGKNDDQPVYCG